MAPIAAESIIKQVEQIKAKKPKKRHLINPSKEKKAKGPLINNFHHTFNRFCQLRDHALTIRLGWSTSKFQVSLYYVFILDSTCAALFEDFRKWAYFLNFRKWFLRYFTLCTLKKAPSLERIS